MPCLPEQMEDYSQYDLTEDDAYVITGSRCLKNKLGFVTTGELNAAEAEITKLTIAELFSNPVLDNFDLHLLQAIHQRLFGDVTTRPFLARFFMKTSCLHLQK